MSFPYAPRVSAWVTMSRDRPVHSCRSTWLNGSSRAPNRDVVRPPPLPTARTRPVLRVSSVTIRSASPSFCTRSTTPVSRYRVLTGEAYDLRHARTPHPHRTGPRDRPVDRLRRHEDRGTSPVGGPGERHGRTRPDEG